MSEYTEGTRGPCDRCEEPVRKSEDATYWEEVVGHLRGGKRSFAGFTRARHLGCSPSRWQYLGGPRQPSYTEEDASLAVKREAAEVLREAVRFDAKRETYEDRVRSLTEERLRARAVEAKP